jgi:hypothetical protein
MTTPDDYRYAKSHLRAAIDHLKLAQHYAGAPDSIVQADLTDLLNTAKFAYDLADSESVKPFIPPPATTSI